MSLSLQLEAQNIVQNGSFEDLSHCPSGGGEIFWAPPWDGSSISPDLYNVCGTNGYSVPANRNGYQGARTGSGYAGLASYSEDFVDAHEFIKSLLAYPLVSGQQYYVEFYTSLSDSMEFASHNLGVTFTDVDTGQSGELLCWPNCSAYVENTSANPLSSKTDWVKVSGTFTANGGERYMHLGNLRNDVNSETEFVGGGGVGPAYDWNYAAYYIDDVWLSHVDSMHYVGVEDLTLREPQGTHLEVYPNPSVGGSVTVKCNLQGGDVAELRVFDAVGKLMFIETLRSAQGNKKMVRLEGLSEGIYHCVLVVNGKASLSEKLVILRQ